MQRAILFILPFFLLIGCVNLSVGNKHKCESDSDCLYGRVCLDQQCREAANASPDLDNALAPDAGSDGSASVGCVNQTAALSPCGHNGRGHASRVCTGGTWSAWSDCDDPDACLDGDAEQMACGVNGRGSSERGCSEGAWSEWSPCEDADLCADGSHESQACGHNGAGSSQRDCERGSWTDWSNCVDLDDCRSGDTDGRACGLNLRAYQTRSCAAGRWSTFMPCDDPDECRDGSTDQHFCGPQHGGLERRACTLGHWAGWTVCDDPALQENDECKSGLNNCDADPPACKDLPNDGGEFACECPVGFAGAGVGPGGCVPVLIGLVPSLGTLEGFEPLLATSHMTLSLATRSVKLKPTAANGVNVTIEGAPVPSGDFSRALVLQAGTNTIDVQVRYGEQKRDYAVTIERGALDAFIKQEQHVTEYGSFGSAVALSGDVLVIGAEDDNDGALEETGAAYVYLRKNDKFEFVQRLTLATPQQYDSLGAAVATDGTTIAVGARYGGHRRGLVALFRRTQDDRFEPELELADPYAAENSDYTNFGTALALSGDFLVVGAPYDHHKPSGSNGVLPGEWLTSSGAIFLYERDPQTNAWTYRGLRKSFEAQSNAKFGASIAFAGQYLLVGAPGQHTLAASGAVDVYYSGAVFVFWKETISPYVVLRAPTPHEFGYLGQRVATVGSGEVWIAGEPGADLVHAFSENGKYSAIAPPLEGSRGFGEALAFTGDQLLVGAPYEDSPQGGVGEPQPNDCDSTEPTLCALGAGAAYLYAFESTGWQLRGFFKPPHPAPYAFFGGAVAMDGTTGMMVMGARNEASTLTGVMESQSYACDVDAPPEPSLSCGSYSGAVYVYD